MASQTQGIQQLLAAEKRAAEKVTEARKRKCIGDSIARNPRNMSSEEHFTLFRYSRQGSPSEAGQRGGAR